MDRWTGLKISKDTATLTCVTFLVYTGFPLYCWCQCGILDHYRYGVMSVAMTFSCVCARGMLEAPLEHASLIAHSVQESRCVRMQ